MTKEEIRREVKKLVNKCIYINKIILYNLNYKNVKEEGVTWKYSTN